VTRTLAVTAGLWLAAASTHAGSPWPTATPPLEPTAAARPAAKKGPVTRDEALAIARKAVAAVNPAAGFVVVEKATIEKPFGWVFFYEPKAAATDPRAVVPGAGPLVVHRHDGSTTYLSSSVPPNVAIEEYEKVWAKRSKP
jgi:hypothetical protein